MTNGKPFRSPCSRGQVTTLTLNTALATLGQEQGTRKTSLTSSSKQPQGQLEI